MYNAAGLYALRFFIGILGGSFVPCQVWTTGFFDKNIVGTANAITGGLGNLGGGITYFVMPTVYHALIRDGLTPHTAWRVSFVVPGILIVSVAICLVVFCEDTPTGKWGERLAASQTSTGGEINQGIVAVGGNLMDAPSYSPSGSISNGSEKEKRGVGEEWKRDNEAQNVTRKSLNSDIHSHNNITKTYPQSILKLAKSFKSPRFMMFSASASHRKLSSPLPAISVPLAPSFPSTVSLVTTIAKTSLI